MPQGIGYPPAAQPPMARKPSRRQLSPEEQAMLDQRGSLTLDDGTVIYPDGTATGAGDSPDDFDYGPGGYANAFGLGAPSPAMEAADPLAGQLFKRFRQTANAPFPGTPGGVGGGPLPDEGPNPMREPGASPFAPAKTAESPMSHVPALPPAAAPPDFVQDQLGGQSKTPRQMPGRMGRRMQPTRGQTMNRRRGR